MSVKNNEFPSSAVFDQIGDFLKSDDKGRDEAVKQGKAIFAFTLKNKGGKQESWYIDLKNKGEVGKGTAPQGAKPTVTLVLSDEDFQKLASGSGNAQNMFMSGKLKLKGNMMAAQRLTPILQKAQETGQAPKAKL